MIKIFNICAGIAIIYTILLGVFKMFPNNEIIWKCQWVVDILSESISVIIFTTLIFVLQKGENVKEDNGEVYMYQLEESKQIPTHNSRHIEEL